MELSKRMKDAILAIRAKDAEKERQEHEAALRAEEMRRKAERIRVKWKTESLPTIKTTVAAYIAKMDEAKSPVNFADAGIHDDEMVRIFLTRRVPDKPHQPYLEFRFDEKSGGARTTFSTVDGKNRAVADDLLQAEHVTEDWVVACCEAFFVNETR
ncbi:MAG: hypothetical protein AB1918_15895 [Pseudomonadota bacterium]